VRPGGFRLLQTWAALCQGACAPPKWRPAKSQATIVWWRRPWLVVSFGPARALCWVVALAPFWSHPLWPRSSWGTGWTAFLLFGHVD
jgi:hypothetical protein